MRCKEVKQWISDHPEKLSQMLPEDIRHHIDSCSDCTHSLKAMISLAYQFSREKNRAVDDTTPLPELQNKLAERSSNSKRGILTMLKGQLKTHPRLLTGFGLMVVIIMALTLIPFSYTTTVGYRLCFNMEDPTQAGFESNYQSVLAALGYGNSDVHIDGDCLRVSSLPNKKAVREAEVVYKLIAGREPDVKVEPIREKTSGSLYAQARLSSNDIKIDVAGKSNAEIEQMIIQRLVAAGMINPEVEVTTLANGDRRISIHNKSEDPDGSAREDEIELEMDTGDIINFTLGGDPVDIDIDTENMTPEEIEQLVRAKLAEKGIHDAVVKVTVTPDGKHEIKIEIEEEK